MDPHLTLAMAGFILGTSAAALVALYWFFTRPYRQARNRVAILLAPMSVFLAYGLATFLLVHLVDHFCTAPGNNLSRYALYPFTAGMLIVTFFTLRAEIRWRRSLGLSTTPAKSQRPLTSGARKKLAAVVTLGALSWGFAIAGIASQPKPSWVFFGGLSWFCFSAIVVIGSNARDRAFSLQAQKLLLVSFAIYEIAMIGLFWKFRSSQPALSANSLIIAIVLLLGAAVSLLVTRRIMPRD